MLIIWNPIKLLRSYSMVQVEKIKGIGLQQKVDWWKYLIVQVEAGFMTKSLCKKKWNWLNYFKMNV